MELTLFVVSWASEGGSHSGLGAWWPVLGGMEVVCIRIMGGI